MGAVYMHKLNQNKYPVNYRVANHLTTSSHLGSGCTQQKYVPTDVTSDFISRYRRFILPHYSLQQNIITAATAVLYFQTGKQDEIHALFESHSSSYISHFV